MEGGGKIDPNRPVVEEEEAEEEESLGPKIWSKVDDELPLPTCFLFSIVTSHCITSTKYLLLKLVAVLSLSTN